MPIKTTQEDHGNTEPGVLHEELPGGFGKAKPREADPALAELAKKVAARHSADHEGFQIGPDGKVRTEGYRP